VGRAPERLGFTTQREQFVLHRSRTHTAYRVSVGLCTDLAVTMVMFMVRVAAHVNTLILQETLFNIHKHKYAYTFQTRTAPNTAAAEYTKMDTYTCPYSNVQLHPLPAFEAEGVGSCTTDCSSQTYQLVNNMAEPETTHTPIRKSSTGDG